MNLKNETRGRPKKKSDQRLPQISRKLFSQHCAVFYSCCMVYVLQTFLKTKHQKRIGHSEGGFTIYQRLDDSYSFQNIEKDCRQWSIYSVLQKPQLIDFIKIVNGCAPKFVFRQILLIMDQIIIFLSSQKIQSIQRLQQKLHKLLNRNENELNRKYKYLRFTYPALKQLRMQKWNCQIASKIKILWRPFIKIISHSIFCTLRGIEKNKYFKPFFSDAENPEQTIIGQLNLEQIVEFQNGNKGDLNLKKDNQLTTYKLSQQFESPQKTTKISSFQSGFIMRKDSLSEIISEKNNQEQNQQNQNIAYFNNLSSSKKSVENKLIRPITLITQPSFPILADKLSHISISQGYQKQHRQNYHISSLNNFIDDKRLESHNYRYQQQSISQKMLFVNQDQDQCHQNPQQQCFIKQKLTSKRKHIQTQSNINSTLHNSILRKKVKLNNTIDAQ